MERRRGLSAPPWPTLLVGGDNLWSWDRNPTVVDAIGSWLCGVVDLSMDGWIQVKQIALRVVKSVALVVRWMARICSAYRDRGIQIERPAYCTP
jgi:hypothetical protein